MLRRSSNLFIFLVLHYQTLNLTLTSSAASSRPPPLNVSHYLYPRSTFVLFSEPPTSPKPSLFLKAILESIAKREGWDLGGLRVSKLNAKRAKYDSVRNYEFGVRLGKTEMVFKVFDQVSKWTKFESLGKRNWSDFECLVKEVGSKAVLDGFKIHGPLELYAAGDDDNFILNLPSNSSVPGLKQILVSEGMTLEVEGAEEIIVFHTPALNGPLYGNALTDLRNKLHSLCLSSLPIHVRGSALVTVYRTQNPDSAIKTNFLSRDKIELLPDKCYTGNVHRKQSSMFDSLSRGATLLENALKSFLGGRSDRKTGFGLKIKIKPSIVVQFQMELQRNITANDTQWSTLGEWRTRPNAERIWFEVVAGIREGWSLKPLTVRKFRPFAEVDSLSWSSLMSNVSFTKFPSVVVPPEHLTLDIKW